MPEIGGAGIPVTEFPPKSKKEQLIDQLQEIFDLRKTANEKLKYLESFDFEKMIETDPETTSEEIAGYENFLKGKTQEPPKSTARGEEVNEIYRQYIETRQILNQLQAKELEVREQIELERMREIPPPPKLPVEPQKKTEIIDTPAPSEPTDAPKKEPIARERPRVTPEEGDEFLKIFNEKSDDILKMLDSETEFTVESVSKKLGVSERFAEVLLDSLEHDHNILMAPDDNGVRRKLITELEKAHQTETARAAALITLARLENYQDVWAASEQEGDEKFLNKTKELWKELVVHGMSKPDKDGKITLLNYSDLDGETAVGLLKRAGINTEKLRYVNKGEHIQGMINIDTGGKHGVVVEDEGMTAFFDHHADNSGNATCAAQITYEALVALGLLKREPWLDKMIAFVTHMDNSTYAPPDPKQAYKDSWRSLLGLSRHIAFRRLVQFFRKIPKEPHEPMTDKELETLKLINESIKQEDSVKTAIETYEGKEGEVPYAERFTVESKKYGKIFVNIKNSYCSREGTGGWEAAKAFGYGAYVLWNPKDESFFVSTRDKLEHSFEQGRAVRDTMWMKPPTDTTKLTVSLEQILKILTDDDLFLPLDLVYYIND
jgi:hypothetical protein